MKDKIQSRPTTVYVTEEAKQAMMEIKQRGFNISHIFREFLICFARELNEKGL